MKHLLLISALALACAASAQIDTQALPYYSFGSKKPSIVAIHKLDLPSFLSFAKPTFDKYKLELDAFAGVSTDTSTSNPLKVGFDIGRSFTIPKSNYQVFAALAVEVSANRPVGGGLILGVRF
jgi:hypothetical protein